MLWYFLAGYIAGAVGIIWLSEWLLHTGRIGNNDERTSGHKGHMDRDV